MAVETWTRTNEQLLHAGYRSLVRRTFRLPDGKQADFDIKQEGPSVCVLALTPHSTVIVAQQYRPGPEMVLFELPGGSMEPGEMPEEAIRRELIEETGYCGEFSLAGINWHCAYSDARRYNFVAVNCVKLQEPQRDEYEYIQVIELPLETFKGYVRNGQLTRLEGAYMGLDKLRLL